MRNWYFRASGPLTVQLTAKNGLIQASVGGFSINISFKAKQADLVYAKINIRTNTIWLDGSYNPLTGKVSGLALSPAVKIDIDVDSGGILKVLNIFQKKNYHIDIESQVEERIREEVYQSLNQLSAQENVVLGLDTVLEAENFSYQGVDLGKAVLQVFEMLEGHSATITTTERQQTLQGTGEIWCGRTGRYERSAKKLSFVRLTVTTSAGYAIRVSEGVDTGFRAEFLGTCGNVQYQ